MKRFFPCLIIVCSVFLFITGCANRGVGPQGGPKDEEPPVVVKETPENGALNYKDPHIEILFNEYIQLDKVSENVLISPPQQRPPEVKAYGKKLYVNFDGELQDSTTYTIDFGSAICDNNEKNALEGYSFSFATGDVIDSLEISGVMLNAEDLNPISGIVAGIHLNLNDSALETLPFTRITKTNAEGKFTIRNIRPDTYRLYGLQDNSRDYLYQPGEGLAMCDSLITPACHRDIVRDTVWLDSLTIDTIKVQEKTFYEPSNVVMIFFKEDKQRQYFQRATREEQHFFSLYFAAPQDSLPLIRPLGEDWMQYALCQPNTTRDTIVYWLTDSAAIGLDTLSFEMTYLKSDSIYQLQPQTDTINAIYRAPRLSERAKAQLEKNKKEKKVELSSNGKSPFEIYNPFRLASKTPIQSFSADSIHLYLKQDSLRKPLRFELLPLDEAKMSFEIQFPWEPEREYEFVADSAAFRDIYGDVNNELRQNFQLRSLDEYSTLVIKVEPFQPNIILQVLDEKDNVLRSLPAVAEGTRFEYLAPLSYYLRLFLDLNGDGKWTTGDFLTKRQPEPVYYFSSKLTLRANWDFEEEFRYLEQPIDVQKPSAIRKDAASKK